MWVYVGEAIFVRMEIVYVLPVLRSTACCDIEGGFVRCHYWGKLNQDTADVH